MNGWMDGWMDALTMQSTAQKGEQSNSFTIFINILSKITEI
jgi:hypothetical protein